jgi:hypothetical protein
MPNVRRCAALALLALATGCDHPIESALSIMAEVEVSTRGRGADSTVVQALFTSLTGGERIDFNIDTLRVQNVTAARVDPRNPVFVARVPLDSAAVANGLRVRLPVLALGLVPHAEFTLYSVARRGSPSLTLRTGQDLVIPVFPGSSGTLLGPGTEDWEVSFTRGGVGVSLSGGGPLPSSIVIPWAQVPKQGSDTMQVKVYSSRHFSLNLPPGAGYTARLFSTVRADANLEWSVLIVP